jgi:hypothetical protein
MKIRKSGRKEIKLENEYLGIHFPALSEISFGNNAEK